MSSRILSIISFSSFIILSFKIRLLMHLQCDRCMHNSIFFFASGRQASLETFVEDAVFCVLHDFCLFVKY